MSKTVHVILQRDVAKLGKGGEVVKVASGYARNYLLPEGFALAASEGNVARFEHQKKVAGEKAAKLRSDATTLANRLGALELTIARTVGGEGKLYGSVTHKDIEAALKAQGFEIDRKKLSVDSIRSTGSYAVTARLAPEVTATFKVNVVADAKSAS